ncbi:MAG: putative arylesterase-like protein [Solirubrobacterales bacterium]|jgi:pimeloyl-ACP methyl ester carboxylesterase|nr:putative arylesterase-like protein [Solirubrobacterales bacterium]
MSDTIVFIHGAWLASNSWERFAAFFSDRGYAALAPEWPRKSGDVAALRAGAADVAGLGVAEIVDHYAGIIDELDDPPIVIGHSFGGLITQILLGRGRGRAAVAMDPAAPKGVTRVPLSSLRAAAPAIAHPSKRHGVVDLDFEQFNYAFTNTWDPADARQAFERYAVPETGRIFFEDGLANFTLHGPTEVDFDREDRGPLLITVAEHDHTVPPAVAKANFHKYHRSEAVTEFVEFPGRSHLLMAGEGWEAVAQYIADWLDRVLRPAPVAIDERGD